MNRKLPDKLELELLQNKVDEARADYCWANVGTYKDEDDRSTEDFKYIHYDKKMQWICGYCSALQLNIDDKNGYIRIYKGKRDIIKAKLYKSFEVWDREEQQ